MRKLEIAHGLAHFVAGLILLSLFTHLPQSAIATFMQCVCGFMSIVGLVTFIMAYIQEDY